MEGSGTPINRIIVIGASNNRDKYGNKAVRAYAEKGYRVYPVNPKEERIEGIECYHSLKDIPEKVELASLYLPPEIGIRVIEDLPSAGVKKVYVNPGSESDDIIKRLKELKIEPLIVCSIVSIGRNPEDL